MKPGRPHSAKDTRPPAVAGAFYEAERDALLRRLDWCFTHPLGPGAAPQARESPLAEPAGYVVPHAGYMFSGPFAAHAYASLARRGMPEVAVIMGPDHRSIGFGPTLSPAAHWETPLGSVEVEGELGTRNREQDPAPLLRVDEAAHAQEHSIEVQVPFLQRLWGSRVRILPIAIADQSYEQGVALGAALADSLAGRPAAVIASSDFSHYLPADEARERDRHALDAIVRLDGQGLWRAIDEYDVTMCGPGPVTAMMECMRRLGAARGRVLAYGNSGDVSGDTSSVVAYAAVEVVRE